MKDAGCRMQDAGYTMHDAGYRMHDAGYTMQDSGAIVGGRCISIFDCYDLSTYTYEHVMA